MYDIEAVLNTWQYLQEGIESILAHTTGDSNLEKIFVDITSKRVLLWVAFLDGVYCGFMTTRIDTQPPLTKKFMTVIHAFLKEGTPKEVFDKGIEQLQEIAKREFKCDAIRFYSTRKGWNRKLSNWKEGYTEYYKDIA